MRRLELDEHVRKRGSSGSRQEAQGKAQRREGPGKPQVESIEDRSPGISVKTSRAAGCREGQSRESGRVLRGHREWHIPSQEHSGACCARL